MRILFFLLTTIALSWNASVHAQQNGKLLIVLDAGHGGGDSGNTAHGFQEKDIALDITLLVGEMLEKTGNYRVVYTREDDTFVTLSGRAKIANDLKADLFVSIHLNSAKNKQAHGTETFVLGTYKNDVNFNVAKRENSVIFLEEGYKENYAGFDPNDPSTYVGLALGQEDYLEQSITLAAFVQKHFTNNVKLRDRGVKSDNFAVLRLSYMPSVLVETGFLSNKKESQLLSSKSGKQKLAKSIFEGIEEYRNGLEYNYIPVPEDVGEPVAETEPAPSGAYFAIQLAAGNSKIDTAPGNWNKLTQVNRTHDGTVYRYYYGKAKNLREAKKLQKEARRKGYESAFVVGFKDGARVPLDEVLN